MTMFTKREVTVPACSNSRPFRFSLSALILFMTVLASTSCSEKKQGDDIGSKGRAAKDSTLVIAMLGDADYLNPVLGTTVTSNNIFSLIYPGLLQSEFDTTTGLLNFIALEKRLRQTGTGTGKKTPRAALAKTWRMAPDHKSITYILRNNAFWNDGKPIVSGDFKFSYKLYGNPVIASARQQYLSELIGAETGQVDFRRAIETPDDTTLIFRFHKPVSEQLALFHTSLTPLPSHYWRSVKPEDFRSSPLNQLPLGAGPYKLQVWRQQQEIVLASNKRSNLPKPGNIPYISYRVVPDYTVRLTQLQTNAVDVVENIKPEDFQGVLKSNAAIEIKTVGLRVFDYVGWSNIDQAEYHKTGKIKPHPLFGSAQVRLALTTAIDRESIIDGYLKSYGVLCNTDISPSLKWAYNRAILAHQFDPAKASALLKAEGWLPGPDGILRKNGRKFSFVLYTNSGNARRNYASVIIQQNLKAIGIDCKLDVQESNVFFENLQSRKLDAWMAGWSIGLEIDPLDVWGSDLKKSRFNFTGYQNPRIDGLCELAKQKMDPLEAKAYWMEYQQILHRDQPVTFLYWIRETQGFNKRIQGEELNISGTFYNIDDWTLNPSATVAL
ncbi:extracellular solute-binding protein, family 5 [Chlorobium phaeobacteroides DSM 266]|uniref:Extracellular solute-binding protein, family 5 n=2 Tax=Chlorobium phaeobacteroides TaxID=1096 RepID=A1BDZ6_CHLPD|nr:extracellular solute-binding protein, family 5 [Chlorobium phaeobacteroides DSM 266]